MVRVLLSVKDELSFNGAGIPWARMHLTGHKSIETVQRYFHLAPDYQERAIRALDGLRHDSGTADAEDDVGADV